MIGELLVGRYRICKKLGRGGFGETFVARDLHMPKEPLCVVKHLKPVRNDPQLLETAIRLFNREAEALAELGEHDQIPRLYAYFTQGADFYLVQEFIEGKDLSHEMQRRWDAHAVCKLIVELMQILEFVHSKRVIHRDIKPDNIIRRRRDNKLVLIDFGAIKAIPQTAMQGTGMMSASLVLGSIGYMAPEQGLGKPQFASDIYSVGMMAIQALTGKHPRELEEDPRGEVVWRNLLDFHSELLSVIEQMVKYVHRERYGSAREVLAALENCSAETRVIVQTSSKTSDDEKTVLQVTEGVRAEKFLKDGEAKFRKKDYQGAIADFTEAIRLKPDHASAYFNRGVVKYNLGDKEGAITDYTQAISLKPDHAGAYYNRGLAKADLGDKEGAITDYTQAINLKPDFALAYYNRGLAKADLGDKEGAIADFTQAISLKPNHAGAYYNRGNAKSALGDKEGAIADFTQAISLNPDDAFAYNNRGFAKSALGDKEGAINDLKQAAQLFQQQGNPELHEITLTTLKLID